MSPCPLFTLEANVQFASKILLIDCTMQYTVFIRKYSANCVNSSNLRQKCLKYGKTGFDLARNRPNQTHFDHIL